MAMTKIEVWRTSDGQIHYVEDEAVEHERSIKMTTPVVRILNGLANGRFAGCAWTQDIDTIAGIIVDYFDVLPRKATKKGTK